MCFISPDLWCRDTYSDEGNRRKTENNPKRNGEIDVCPDLKRSSRNEDIRQITGVYDII